MDSSLLFLSKKAIALPLLIPSIHRRPAVNRLITIHFPSAFYAKRSSIVSTATSRSSFEMQIVEDSDVVPEACCHSENITINTDPFVQSASLVRGLVLLRPVSLFRRFVSKGTTNKPPTFTAILLSAMIYCWMAVKSAIQSKVRACTRCSGFGITRCDLCEGHQVIWWEGKYKHVEPCPKCFGRRYVRCAKCGGFFGRSIFVHKTQESLDTKRLAQLEKELKIDESWVGAPKWVT